MKCDKCNNDFLEKDIDESHDIPKYLGGTDKDGRHWLCKKCHDEYEWKILKIALMCYIKQLPEVDKVIFRNSAKIVKQFFFKNRGEKDDT